MRPLLSLGLSVVLITAVRAAPQTAPVPPPADTPTTPAPIELQQETAVPARQLTLKIGLDRPTAGPGQPIVLVADITPQPRIHVYAPGATGYLPIELKVDSPAVTIQDPAQYPPAVRRFLPAVNESADVYESRFQIRQPVVLAAAAGAGAPGAPLTIAGILKYQACNETVCFRPETVKFVWTVPLAP
jgi:hypothetical protein